MFSHGFLSVQYLVFMFPPCQVNGNRERVFLFSFLAYHDFFFLHVFHWNLSTHRLPRLTILNTMLPQPCDGLLVGRIPHLDVEGCPATDHLDDLKA